MGHGNAPKAEGGTEPHVSLARDGTIGVWWGPLSHKEVRGSILARVVMHRFSDKYPIRCLLYHDRGPVRQAEERTPRAEYVQYRQHALRPGVMSGFPSVS